MNNEEQDAVNTEVETTTAEESATTENESTDSETEDTQSTSADTSVEPEKKVSENVPYERFSKVNQEKKELEEVLKRVIGQGQNAPSQQMANDIPQLDPESREAVRHTIREEWEQQKAADFQRKHAQDLSDPLIAATTAHLIREANARGDYVDQEEALNRAKDMISERATPKIKEASEQGLREGQELAKKKLENTAIGTTTSASPKLDDSKLSADELRRKYNIPRDTELV